MSSSLQKLAFTPASLLSASVLVLTPALSASAATLEPIHEIQQTIVSSPLVASPSVKPIVSLPKLSEAVTKVQETEKTVLANNDPATVNAAAHLLPPSMGSTLATSSEVAGVAKDKLVAFVKSSESLRAAAVKKAASQRSAKLKAIAAKNAAAKAKAETERKRVRAIAAANRQARKNAAINAAALKATAQKKAVAQAKAASLEASAQATTAALDAVDSSMRTARVAPATSIPSMVAGKSNIADSFAKKTYSASAAMMCSMDAGDTLMTEWVGKIRGRVKAQFGINNIGGSRPGDTQDHGKGLALDIMVPVGGKLGDEVLAWSMKNFKSLNLSYAIWKQTLYAPYSPHGRKMSDRGSITQNHFDHVHLSFKTGKGTCPPFSAK